jgi:hypothetical protein
MRRHARTMVPIGLGVGLVLAGVAAAALWSHRVPGVSRILPARVVSGPGQGMTGEDGIATVWGPHHSMDGDQGCRHRGDYGRRRLVAFGQLPSVTAAVCIVGVCDR